MVHGVGAAIAKYMGDQVQARKATIVKPIEAYVDGDKLVQVFEYVDGPKKGERTKLVTKIASP